MATFRKYPLENGNYFHVFSKSIAKFVVFNNDIEFSRMYELIDLCRFSNFNYKMSRFKNFGISTQNAIITKIKKENNRLVEIISYCLMPTHLHFILKQMKDNGITKYMSRILNSYSKYFNLRHKRSGPLWTSEFKNVLIENNEQLLHLTRYIHLNPASAGIVAKPEDWKFSSYRDFITPQQNKRESICKFDYLFNITPNDYKRFVDDQKSYQKKLSRIKNLLIDDYSG